MVNRFRSTVATYADANAGYQTLKIKLTGGGFSGWYAGTQNANEIALTGLSEGYLALAASNGKFKTLKAGYDSECDQGGSTNSDDDIADAGDDVALNEAFGATETSP